MKLLIVTESEYGSTVQLRTVQLYVVVAEIVRGYFSNTMAPLVCLMNDGRFTTPEKGMIDFCNLYSGNTTGFVGILEASDEEINVLRDAGYKRLHDLRTATLAAFLEEHGLSGSGPPKTCLY
ncbi:MAG: hypothetical protein ABSH05_26930 [Bryobacteraceae bacterium]|jgi:hypothetical protein